LHRGDPLEALSFFMAIKNLPYGLEMSVLCHTLNLFKISDTEKHKVSAISCLQPYSIPPLPHLHSDSWLAIASFHRIITAINTVETSFSRSAKSFALNRALGELDKLIKQSKTIVTAEKDLIAEIAQDWQRCLLPLSSEIGEIEIREAVKIPYTIGDPVEGDAFVGREDIMYQLAELWRTQQSIQSVVIYGHRRMGKTSILRNINRHLGEDVRLVYVNMLLISNPSGEVDLLMFICDEIQKVTGIKPPTNADFIAFPETTCRRYIQQVIEQLGNRKLIIAIDEFECIDRLIESSKITPGFLQFLRGLVQLSPQIAFAFAGLHTLEERVANYDEPFFASFIPIHVDALNLGTTRQLLANPPDPDFPLDFAPETLDQIYALTGGQPYLTQLVGFQLVRHYNQQAFEEGHTRDSLFTLGDLESVMEGTSFFDRGRYYFTGVWGQANQDVPHQQTILQALAPHPEGLTLSELNVATNLSTQNLTDALKVLDRHDVAHYESDRWKIAIELFRRWVADRLYLPK
jgi:hypothetical protein